MFEWLAEFDRILVTGPQRAGTRICAQMIAQDTGHAYIDEREFGYDSLYGLVGCLENRHHLVVQCPILCRYVHLFSADGTAIVLMRRNLQDIAASQKRIKWTREWLELGRYDRAEGAIAEVKYRFWEEYQKPRIKHAFEVEYANLSQHPLWVNQSLRQDFEPEQTIPRDRPGAIGHDDRLCPNDDIFYWEPSNDAAAILAKIKEPAKVLNATGRAVWKLCDGTHTLSEIAQMLGARVDPADERRLCDDLTSFLRDLLASGFLRVVPR